MILFIDTSKPETRVALYDSESLLAEKTWISAKNQSEELLSEIEKLLKSIGTDKTDLTNIAVITGPGSYTGLRVGLSTANALAVSLNIGIFGLDGETNTQNSAENIDYKKSEFVTAIMPIYKFPPKITTKKPRR